MSEKTTNADPKNVPDPKSVVKFWIVEGSTKPARSMKTVEECLKTEAPKPPREITADEMLKIPFTEDFMHLATKDDANRYIEQRKRELVARATKIKRAQDKTERDREAFRQKNPAFMRKIDRQAQDALEGSAASVKRAKAAEREKARIAAAAESAAE